MQRPRPLSWERFVLVVLLLALAVPVAAADETPSPEPRRVAVIFVDAQGQWDRAVQEAYEAQKPTGGGVTWVTWSQMLDAPRIKTLSAEQKAALFKFPEMLLSSSRRSELTTVPFVLLAEYTKPGEGTFFPALVNMYDGSQLELATVKGEPTKSLAKLSEQATAGVGRQITSVLGYIPGKQYHVQGCDHVRLEETILISSEVEARANGYDACSVCFPSQASRKRDELEIELGKQVSGYIEYQYRIDTDQARQERVQRVGRQMVEKNDLRNFEYSFRVLQSDEINAFAAGAGHVYITRGLEKVTAGNDDMLAAILGHEMGHVERHHVVRQYRVAQTYALLGAIISVATGTNLGALLADFAGGIISRGHSRGFEAEADRVGITYAYGAGYRPEDFVFVMNAFKKLSAGKDKGPGWLRTHPTEEKRLEIARVQVEQLKALEAIADSYRPVDEGMAIYIRNNAADLLTRREELARNLTALASSIGPSQAQVVDTPEETPVVSGESRPEPAVVEAPAVTPGAINPTPAVKSVSPPSVRDD